MKKLLILLLTVVTFTNCKNDSKTETSENEDSKTEKQEDGLTVLEGDFVYYADAAVLQTKNEVFGVIIDEKMHELDKLVKKHKIEPTDMIPVVIKGNVLSKPEGEEGWPLRIEVKEILKVSEPDPNRKDVVKLGTDKKASSETKK